MAFVGHGTRMPIRSAGQLSKVILPLALMVSLHLPCVGTICRWRLYAGLITAVSADFCNMSPAARNGPQSAGAELPPPGGFGASLFAGLTGLGSPVLLGLSVPDSRLRLFRYPR